MMASVPSSTLLDCRGFWKVFGHRDDKKNLHICTPRAVAREGEATGAALDVGWTP